MKVQSEKQILHRAVRDSRGRRLGRVAAVDYASDPYTVAWLLLRLAGWRLQLRAVPAGKAQWTAGGPLTVPYRREDVARSTPLTADGELDAVRRRELAAFYAALDS